MDKMLSSTLTLLPNTLLSMGLMGLSTILIFCWKDSKFVRPLKAFLNNVRIFLEDFCLLIFTIGWLVVLGPIYGASLFWRLGVWTYLKLRYGDLGDLVSALDVIGTMDTDKSKQIIKSLKVLEGPCDLEDLRRRCEATVGRRHPCQRDSSDPNGRLVYPKFYQILGRCGGYFCWRPSNFDIGHHLRFCDGLDMTSPSTSETEALDICGRLSNLGFAHDRANWEILVIPKFHYDHEHDDNEVGGVVKGAVEKHAIIIRIHHGLGDGYSLMKLIMRDMAGESEVFIPVSNKPNSSWWYGILIFCYIALKSPRAFYKEMFVRDQNPLHNDRVGASGDKSMVWSERISLDFLKQTKNKLGSGMSTILLSALAGAIRRYMVEELGTTTPPSEINAVMPVPAPNHPDSAMVNKFSIILFPLSTKSKDPVIRSKEIDRQGRIAAQSPDAVMNLFLMNLSGVLPIVCSRPFVTNHQATVVVSNIPGPHKSIKIWNKKLCDTMFWLPHLGTSGISVSFLSYETHLRIGLTVDSGIIHNGQVGAKFLINAMVDELNLMGQSVGLDSTMVLSNVSKGPQVSPMPPNSLLLHQDHRHQDDVDDNNNNRRNSQDVSPDRSSSTTTTFKSPGAMSLQSAILADRKHFRRLASRE